MSDIVCVRNVIRIIWVFLDIFNSKYLPKENTCKIKKILISIFKQIRHFWTGFKCLSTILCVRTWYQPKVKKFGSRRNFRYWWRWWIGWTRTIFLGMVGWMLHGKWAPKRPWKLVPLSGVFLVKFNTEIIVKIISHLAEI